MKNILLGLILFNLTMAGVILYTLDTKNWLYSTVLIFLNIGAALFNAWTYMRLRDKEKKE